MRKDIRYTAAKRAIEKNDITQLHEIFEVIPRTVVATDLGVAPTRFSSKLLEVEKFSLKEIFRLAELLNIDSVYIFSLAKKQYTKANKIGSSKIKTINRRSLSKRKQHAD